MNGPSVIGLVGSTQARLAVAKTLMESNDFFIVDEDVAVEALASQVLGAVMITGDDVRLFPDAPRAKVNRKAVAYVSMTDALFTLGSDRAREVPEITQALARLYQGVTDSDSTQTFFLDIALRKSVGGMLTSVVTDVTTRAKAMSVESAGGTLVWCGPVEESVRRRRSTQVSADMCALRVPVDVSIDELKTMVPAL